MQLLRTQTNVIVRYQYNSGKVVFVQIEIIYPDSGSFIYLKYISNDGENFKNCLESSESNNDPTFFDRLDQRTDEERERDRTKYFNQERLKYYGD